MRNIFLVIALCVIAFFHAVAETESEARKLYESKDYMGAISLMQKELTTKGASPELYFDLGNVYYKAGNYGAAVLNYERALCLDPSMDQAANNLAVATDDVLRINESLTGDRSLDPVAAAPTALHSLSMMITSLGSNFWCVTSVILFILAVAAVIIYVFCKGVMIRKFGFFGGGIILVLSVIALIFSFMARADVLDGDKAVIMSREAHMRVAPSSASKEVAAPLANGTLVKRLEERKGEDGENWTLVYLNADYTGWLPSADIEKIAVPGFE